MKCTYSHNQVERLSWELFLPHELLGVSRDLSIAFRHSFSDIGPVNQNDTTHLTSAHSTLSHLRTKKHNNAAHQSHGPDKAAVSAPEKLMASETMSGPDQARRLTAINLLCA